MDIAVTFTINDRPEYLAQTLDSWATVRGIHDVSFYFNVEPSDPDIHEENMRLLRLFFEDNRLKGATFHNRKKLGVLGNPHKALTYAFACNHEYVILAEDDLVVSDDILEYHQWASKEYETDREVAMVCSFSSHYTSNLLAYAVIRQPGFASVWIWGTWRGRWETYIAPTWDHDYSTADERGPGGWDWNLNKRVLPSLGKKSVVPLVSRVKNIGLVGTHSTGTVDSPSFALHREPVKFVELGVDKPI